MTDTTNTADAPDETGNSVPLFTFYDIESLDNVFSVCAYTPRPAGRDTLEIFHLADDPTAVAPQQLIVQAAREANPAMPVDTEIAVWNLTDELANLHLAQIVGLDGKTDEKGVSLYARSLHLTRDTDRDYDPARHPYLCGYNSLNYDTIMLALYLMETQVGLCDRSKPFSPATAREMRAHSDQIISGGFQKATDYLIDPEGTGERDWNTPQNAIRRAMLASGRHVDVCRLNEVQSRVSLKRLLGMIGRQILESDKLGGHNAHVENAGQLAELLAYNVSDCVGLAKLFEHPVYAGSFELRASLLKRYPQTVYETDEPDPARVRRNRLRPDSSSAQFVARILCPDDHKPLKDMKVVSFDYPSKRIAKQRGIERTNVLEDCLEFFQARVTDPRARAAFTNIYRYYKQIEGKNFNTSPQYRKAHPDGPAAVSLADIPKLANNLMYVEDADGTPSTCFATFSTGGIHGAELDVPALQAARNEVARRAEMITQVSSAIPDPHDFLELVKTQHNQLRLPDGTTVDKPVVLRGSNPDTVAYRKPKKSDPLQCEQLARAKAQVPDPADLLATQRAAEHKFDLVLGDGKVIEGKTVLANRTAKNAAYHEVPNVVMPPAFESRPDGSNKLKAGYTYTSADFVAHEDFTSYYPNLLRNMSAFYNPALGEDRYAALFGEKERLGCELKKPGIPSAAKARLTTLRGGTKLLLNAASGAGDASFDNTIRMNNTVIAMRIIGQLFSWRIGQAQTLAGGRIISTNTDGLYSALDPAGGFDRETNDRVLAGQAEAINIQIEPEPMFLISKDSNNRLELAPPAGCPDDLPLDKWEIVGASGGTLACHQGPRPDKSLAHPAVVDHVLAQYLHAIAVRSLSDPDAFRRPFDEELGRELVEQAAGGANRVEVALLFQTMITASHASITYPFAADPLEEGETVSPDGQSLNNRRALQHVNRVFVVRPGTSDALSLHSACARVVTDAVRRRREVDGAMPVNRYPVPCRILAQNGWAENETQAKQPGMSLIDPAKDIAVRKIPGIDPTWSVRIVNDDLHLMDTKALEEVLRHLDLGVYTRMLADTFEKNWRNVELPARAPSPPRQGVQA